MIVMGFNTKGNALPQKDNFVLSLGSVHKLYVIINNLHVVLISRWNLTFLPSWVRLKFGCEVLVWVCKQVCLLLSPFLVPFSGCKAFLLFLLEGVVVISIITASSTWQAIKAPFGEFRLLNFKLHLEYVVLDYIDISVFWFLLIWFQT